MCIVKFLVKSHLDINVVGLYRHSDKTKIYNFIAVLAYSLLVEFSQSNGLFIVIYIVVAGLLTQEQNLRKVRDHPTLSL